MKMDEITFLTLLAFAAVLLLFLGLIVWFIVTEYTNVTISFRRCALWKLGTPLVSLIVYNHEKIFKEPIHRISSNTDILLLLSLYTVTTCFAPLLIQWMKPELLSAEDRIYLRDSL